MVSEHMSLIGLSGLLVAHESGTLLILDTFEPGAGHVASIGVDVQACTSALTETRFGGAMFEYFGVDFLSQSLPGASEG